MKDENTYFIGKRVRARVVDGGSIDLSLDVYFQFVRVDIDGSIMNAAFQCDRDGNPVVTAGTVIDAEIADSLFASPPFTEKSRFMFINIQLVSGLGLFDHLKGVTYRPRFPD